MISEKLQIFQKQGVFPVQEISRADLYGIGVSWSNYLGLCLFENHVSISSPVISRAQRTFVGAYSYVNDGGYIRSNVFVGRYCSIGRRVTIGAGSHSLLSVSTSPLLRCRASRPYTDGESERLGNKIKAPVFTVLMNDVWVGDGAVIVPGVTVGTGAVIGANAVVVADVAPYSIVGGVPARLIRYRFPDEVINDLLNSCWWELSSDQLALLPMGNVFEFLEHLDSASSFSVENFPTYSLKS